jgi:hypothetical protein
MESTPTAPVSVTRSYYDILGVSNTASTADINEAYESLAYGQKEVDAKDMAAYHEATKVRKRAMDGWRCCTCCLDMLVMTSV